VTTENVKVSRADRQAQTRERLIEVAREMFLADGYAATSLDKVAVRAGFSKGAVYSNFAGKEQLCMAVLDSIHEEQIHGVVTAFTQDTDLDGRIEAFAAWAREGLGQPRWTALEVEFGAIARQSPYVATELVKRHREIWPEQGRRRRPGGHHAAQPGHRSGHAALARPVDRRRGVRRHDARPPARRGGLSGGHQRLGVTRRILSFDPLDVVR
jgi:AcrR family transcriptional regulator